jgi:hypothetical protein
VRSICGDVEFKVLSPDGSTEVGKISKQWSGLLREAFTDADNFGISFPMDLVIPSVWSQSYDRELQRQSCKNLQRN